MYSLNFSDSNYMEFIGYDTCEKLIWTSVEGSRNVNKPPGKGVLKQISTRYLLHQNLILFVPHIKAIVISCQNIWFHASFKHINKKGRVLIEIYK